MKKAINLINYNYWLNLDIKSVKQMEEIKRINDKLSESNDKLEKAYLEMVETLRFAVEAKDTYTRGHSDRVSEYSVLLAKN